MSTINFTNSSGLALQFTNHDLDLVLTELTTGNTYYSVGNNDLVYIMLGNGYLLVMDVSYTINRKLFECYHFSASNLYPFQLKLTNDSTSSVMSINDALIASGYSGVTPISSLSSVYMMIYIQSGSNLDVYSKDHVNQLLLNLIDNAPSNLDTLNELALALQGESTQEANDVASILTQLSNKLKKANPNYTGTLKNSDDSFQVDASGNVMVTGVCDRDVTTAVSNDAMTILINSSGALQWNKNNNGTRNANDVFGSIVFSSSGNAWIAGGFNNTGTQMDASVMNYSVAGTLNWTKNYNGGGDYSESSKKILVDASGNSYSAGNTFSENQNYNAH